MFIFLYICSFVHQFFRIHIVTYDHLLSLYLPIYSYSIYDKVDVFMLDLDVGFLADPKGIVKTFYETPEIDIFVQVFQV
jgi:hypothetical protein